VGRFLEQLCDVLQTAHSRDIIHRDLKPSNLMVMQPDTPQEHIKVMDFGLAKICQNKDGKEDKITDPTAEFVGTPGYISPEQARGEELDHRSDLYSVGVIAYELLSGQLPFQRSSPIDMMVAHATEIPATFKEMGLRSWVPRVIEEVVLSCLEKQPDQRPQSAHDLLESYRAALGAAEAKAAEVEVLEVLPADNESGVFEIDAWMPQEIARIKLRGFVHDCRGEVLESEPGRILMRLRHGSSHTPSSGLSWFKSYRGAVAEPPLDAELRLEQREGNRDNHLHITVSFVPADPAIAQNPAWQEHCQRVFCEIRSYLMGQ
jgi:serine/threonine-protein kinase